jgi:hypothetical protein
VIGNVYFAPEFGNNYTVYLLGADKLQAFAGSHSEAAGPLRALAARLEAQDWRDAAHLAGDFGAAAAVLPDGRVELSFPWCGARVALRADFQAFAILVEAVTVIDFKEEAP